MFRNRLEKTYRHLSRQAQRRGITCFRVYDHDLPEFPFAIEKYGDYVSVSEYRRRHGMTPNEHETWLQGALEVIGEVTQVPADHIFSRTRQRKPGRYGQYRRQDSESKEIVVQEGGLQFYVNLGDYLDTGLFLDHRETRSLVRMQSKNKSVLNLFAYTGSFSVYAAAGGAASVTTVDMSRTYLDWARRNFSLNKMEEGDAFRFIQADVISFLEEEKGLYDLVVLDPPTFSNSKRMDKEFDVQRDHASLIRQCLRILSPGGIIYFSTNYTRFTLDEAAIPARVRDITRQTTPFDFEGKLKRVCFLIFPTDITAESNP